MIFLKKNTRTYDIFFKLSEKMVFSKGPLRDMIFLVLPGNMVFFPENMIFFSLGRKWEMIFLKKYMDIWYFLCKRTSVTNMAPRPSVKKKIKDGIIPQKYT